VVATQHDLMMLLSAIISYRYVFHTDYIYTVNKVGYMIYAPETYPVPVYYSEDVQSRSRTCWLFCSHCEHVNCVHWCVVLLMFPNE